MACTRAKNIAGVYKDDEKHEDRVGIYDEALAIVSVSLTLYDMINGTNYFLKGEVR